MSVALQPGYKVHSPATATDIPDFIKRWSPGGKSYRLGERAGAQPHFLELCALLGVETPVDSDDYCFERGHLSATGRGFADVWKRGHFAWEYKAPNGDLDAALKQLVWYALPLENPPLLVVSDRLRIRIHTHFTGYPSEKTVVALQDLTDPVAQDLLRSLFTDPYRLRPSQTVRQVTEQAAGIFARIADEMRARGVNPSVAAHFLTQCVFCLFADDAGLLPDDVFRRLVRNQPNAKSLQRSLTALFEKMQAGGAFGVDHIPWFNGGLFKRIDVPDLTQDDAEILARVAADNWRAIDASIFGTLFERGLDPDKRAQLGAHYTDPATIERLLEPVIRRPLLAEWDSTKRRISGLLSTRDFVRVQAKGVPSKSPDLKERYARLGSRANRAQRDAQRLFAGFLDRLAKFRVLDPACGSGNFLYLALRCLKDIELLANLEAEELGLHRQFPVTGPQNVLGIETNDFASELAKVTVWIGQLQWLLEHKYGVEDQPILPPLDHIERRDAIVTTSGKEATWPSADVVVGNPPFLGDKKMRGELGEAYVRKVRSAYEGRVPGGADLVSYWLEKARAGIESGKFKRAGLVATSSVRGGRSRQVLDRICTSSRIFEAWSDEPWINEGAAVRVSLIAFGDSHQPPSLNGRSVKRIAADLTAAGVRRGADLTQAEQLAQNAHTAFSGIQKTGPFEVPGDLARRWLEMPNPEGRRNIDVVRPWYNGLDVVRRNRDMWIIDFGADMTMSEAALYEQPFKHVTTHVKPTRVDKREARTNERFWQFQWARPQMRQAICGLARFIVTPEVSKHRVFEWLPAGVVPDKNLVVIARCDDATFGVLHSRMHRVWSLGLGTTLEDRPRYTPTSCFETFPFPEGLAPVSTRVPSIQAKKGGLIPSGLTSATAARATDVASAAARLIKLRNSWLNPQQWTKSVPQLSEMDAARGFMLPGRTLSLPGHEKDLAARTLTNLYNEMPQWLIEVHESLDCAVARAYGWADYAASMTNEELLARLLTFNKQRQSRAKQLSLV